MRTWVDIAVLAHTKNVNGGLVARGASGLPVLLEEGLELALVPPVLDAPRIVHVESASARTDFEALVFFEEVPDANTADMLVGCHCLARRADVDALEAEYADELPSWEGWRVFDEQMGFVGIVEGIEERPLQPLLVVAREGRQSAFVPLVDDLVVSVDEDERRIELACPAGLLEL